jgi:hypothetical protein
MKLQPVSTRPAPAYPTRQDHRLAPWKRAAAVVGATVALWLPACGGSDDTCVRTQGTGDDVRLAGEEPAVQMPPDGQQKPPVNIPPDQVRPPGTPPVTVTFPDGTDPAKPPAAETPPPPRPPDDTIRLAGRIRPPRYPPSSSD